MVLADQRHGLEPSSLKGQSKELRHSALEDWWWLVLGRAGIRLAAAGFSGTFIEVHLPSPYPEIPISFIKGRTQRDLSDPWGDSAVPEFGAHCHG